MLGSEHPDTLTSMANVSACLSELGQHEAAATMAQHAVELKQRVLGPEHPSTLDSMANLSNRLADLGIVHISLWRECR